MPLDSLPVEFLCSLHLDVGESVMLTNGPAGTKVIAPVVGGEFHGPRLEGAVRSPAGDWVTVGPNGHLNLDVRLCLVTGDGANIYCSYRGLLLPGENGMRAIGTPLFETGDERYSWLTSIQGIGLGNATQVGVDYEVYALR